MRKTGMNISLYVYDTKADTYELRKILDKPNMLEMDLVIGPVYNELVDIAARWAQRNRINMVMPVSQSDQYLMNNRYVFQANPSVEARVEKAAMYLARYWDKNIVILHNNTDVEKNLIEIYKNKLAGSFDYSTGIEQVVIKEINCKLRGLDKIESALSQGENIVIVPSSDEAFASEIVNKLYSYADKYKIHVFGMSNWVNFQNMELQYLQKLNGTFFTTGYINYSNKHVANFVASYRTKFKAEPDEFAYQGFDIMYYFCSALKRYGPNFKDCLSPTDIYPSKYGLRTTFEFDNIDRYSGFRNKGVFIVRINENFETVPVEVDQNVNYFFKFEWN
ncbi:MAG TPA: hypothetical protein DCQ31_12300 [Bacteroidales bacterium]|nr:hypothetical protein [Bacteroidales bacterium]